MGKFTVRLNCCSELLRDDSLFPNRNDLLALHALNLNEVDTYMVLNIVIPSVPLIFKLSLLEKNLVFPSKIIATLGSVHILNSQREAGTSFGNTHNSESQHEVGITSRIASSEPLASEVVLPL